jgi:diguanylate cyclase (GGDEF)-like protein
MINRSFDDRTPQILVVDDERVSRMVLCRTLEKDGIQVHDVGSGEECLLFCQSQSPDLILLDAVMLEMDGFQCCEELHKLLGDQCPPVLIVTSLNDQASIDRAFATGATDYITKPIHWAVLRQRVRRLIQSYWAMTELQRLVSLDGLTQIANRRRFDEVLHQEWGRLAREQLPLSLLMCDVDCFKAFNDAYGHQAGDDCLRQVAGIISQSVKRSTDLVARYGGEEFCIVLPNTDAKGGMRVAENIRLQLKRAAIAHPRSAVNPLITLSIGVASILPMLKASPHQLISLADRALYQAKAEGRDRAVLYRVSAIAASHS